jgi:hypothetical protein
MSFRSFSIDRAAANFFVDVLCLNRNRREHDVAINFSFLLSIDDVMNVYFLFSLSIKFSMLEIKSCLICSWNEHDVCRRSLIREKLQFRSCAIELIWDFFVCARSIEIHVQFVRYFVTFSANHQRHVFDLHMILRMRL